MLFFACLTCFLACLFTFSAPLPACLKTQARQENQRRKKHEANATCREVKKQRDLEEEAILCDTENPKCTSNK